MLKVDSLDDFLKETKDKIDAYIFDFLPRAHERVEVRRLYEMMGDYPMRSGKRLRPALCLLICEAFGGNPADAFNASITVIFVSEFIFSAAFSEAVCVPLNNLGICNAIIASKCVARY